MFWLESEPVVVLVHMPYSLFHLEEITRPITDFSYLRTDLNPVYQKHIDETILLNFTSLMLGPQKLLHTCRVSPGRHVA